MSDIVRTADTDVAPGSMLALIERMASTPEVDVTKLQALLDMQFKLEERAAERAFNEALARVTFGMPRIGKHGTIDLGTDKSSGQKRGAIPFARWEDMDAVIRPRLEAEGFTLSFNSAPRPGDGGGAVVSGTLLHRDGHSRTVSIPLPLDTGPGRNNLQAMGSTLSYGKRYCTEMLLNLVREGVDDDGVAGGTRYITQEQLDELLELIDVTKSDTARFCQAYGIKSVGEMKADSFTPAKNLLEQKRAKMGKSG